MNKGLGYTRDKTPQRAARTRAKELRMWAAGLRDFVREGQTEKYQEERYNKTRKTTTKEGLKVQGMNEGEARKIIQEAERMELLADITLEILDIRE